MIRLLMRIRRSIWREPWPVDRRGQIRLALNDLLLHLHAPTIPQRALRITYSFGLGGLSILLFVVLAITGILLMFAYTPTPDEAYTSIKSLHSEIWLGQLIRNLHHWSANLLLILAGLHMLRVFYTAAFHTPREFNWILGLLLLVLVAALNFTGYLLPWDQRSYWAVTISTGMIDYIPLVGSTIRHAIVGGPEVGASTLRNFFAFHVALLPFLTAITISYHIWRVRKDTFTIPRAVHEPPLSRRQIETITTIPHLVVLELAGGLILLAVLLVWSMWVDAPLLAAADPNHPPNPSKAAWYFMGIQELLLHLHPVYVTFVIPILALGALVLLPYLDFDERRDPDVSGIWFRSIRGRWLVLAGALVGIIWTVVAVLLDEYWLDLPQLLDFLPASISSGLLPLSTSLLLLAGLYYLVRAHGVTVTEANQALFSLLMAAFITLTVIGVYFRGENMTLVLPWER